MMGFNVLSFIVCSVLLLLRSICHADSNVSSGWECSDPDNSTSETAFKTNLDSLLSSVAANGPPRDGFYTTSVGKKSDKIYGLVQCRGDVSAVNCANCTKESTTVALRDCPNSKKVKVWFTWCFLRYSNENFFGEWDPSSSAIFNETNFDDPSVVSKGLNFMSEVAAMAAKQPWMFYAAMLDAEQSGKRYGMAQCTRDISKSDCGKCLDAQLMSLRTAIGNKRGWEVYGSSCSMWYHEYHFYFNFSTPANDAAARRSCLHAFAICATTGVLMFSLVL